MRIYIDGPWSEDVRKYGAPMRIYVHTKHWTWIIGLWPTIKAQVWTGSEGYTDRFRWIVKHPRLRYHISENCMWNPKNYTKEEWMQIKEVMDRT